MRGIYGKDGIRGGEKQTVYSEGSNIEIAHFQQIQKYTFKKYDSAEDG
jgi:hypothetical protein